MLKLDKALNAWGETGFEAILKAELEELPSAQLPLQAGLAHSSYVSDDPFSVIILGVNEVTSSICIKAGIFYSGTIAGCSCADDPTPLDRQNEYCEIELQLDKASGEALVRLLS